MMCAYGSCAKYVDLVDPECLYFKPQEIQYLEEEHHRAKTTLQSRVKDREDEIQKLRNQVSCFYASLNIIPYGKFTNVVSSS